MLDDAGALSFDIKKCVDVIKQKIPNKQRKFFQDFAKIWYKKLDMHYKLTLHEDDVVLFLSKHWQMLQKPKDKSSEIDIYDATIVDANTNETRFVDVIDIATEEVPHLVESMLLTFSRMQWDMQKYFYISLPIVRDKNNHYIGIDAAHTAATREVFCVFMLQATSAICDTKLLEEKLIDAIEDLTVSYAAQERMQKYLMEVQTNWQSLSGANKNETKILCEVNNFIDWLLKHYRITGVRYYKLVKGDNLEILPEKCAGVYSLPRHFSAVKRPFLQPTQEQAGEESFFITKLLYITKANVKSNIIRDEFLDLIGLRILNNEQQVTHEIRFIGLLDGIDSISNHSRIPLIRLKIDNIHHSAKNLSLYHKTSLRLILNSIPIEELFQAKLEFLYQTAVQMLMNKGTSKVIAFFREDFFKSFYTIQVLVPSTYYDKTFKKRLKKFVQEHFNSQEIQMKIYYPMANFVMVYTTIQNITRKSIEYNPQEMSQKIRWLALPWESKVKVHLHEIMKNTDAEALYQQFVPESTEVYRNNVKPTDAAFDIQQLARLSNTQTMLAHINTDIESESDLFLLRLYLYNQDVTLTDLFPIVKNLGMSLVKERKYDIESNHQVYSIISLSLTSHNPLSLTQSRAKTIMRCITQILAKNYQNDALNSLLMFSDISIEQLEVIRAYMYYLVQLKFDLRLEYMIQTSLTYPELVNELIALFMDRFTPHNKATNQDILEKKLGFLEKLEVVKTLNEDKFFKALTECIFATMRTNFFIAVKDCLVLKIYPRLISFMPNPKPKIETFVFSNRVVGTHLRMNKISRGGLRWSSRKEDYRTEVLGLMQAQQLKNAIIGPDGGKGVFVPCMLKGTKHDFQEALECYRVFIQSLLSISDNIVNNQVITPENVEPIDGPDTYLVVAADKGTATFSDEANQIAHEKHFWLGDAFASGGKNGYDHKKLGITAIGAWQSLYWHMKSIGKDVYKTPFTMIGIGDMSGDVFGNGVLVTQNIKLVAAFDHRHIFIDPTPKATQATLNERKRLFKLASSSWDDYNRDKISAGGGVFSRSEKYIKLSKEMKTLFDFDEDKIAPDALIQKILMLDVDVLFNAGIGTFVKATAQSHAEVGDIANDTTRVNGKELRAKAVIEGGNLGLTQQARVEYALHGGLINLDAVDNAGGVLCSDYEVNIKILLQLVVDKGLITYPERNKLLNKYTNEVVDIVLDYITLQNIAITLAESQVTAKIPIYIRYIKTLYDKNIINKNVDAIPDEKVIKTRLVSNQSLTRPEIAVLISYTKLQLVKDIAKSSIVDDPFCNVFLLRCFPPTVRKEYQEQLLHHPLKRKIIATRLSGYCIRVMGITYLRQMADEVQASSETALKAMLIVNATCDLDNIILYLDSNTMMLKESQETIVNAYQEVRSLMRNVAQWFVINENKHLSMPISVCIEPYKEPLQVLTENLEAFESNDTLLAIKKKKEEYIEAGIDKEVADKISKIGAYHHLFPLIHSWSKLEEVEIVQYAQLYTSLYKRLNINWLVEKIESYPIDTVWSQMAKVNIINTLHNTIWEICETICMMIVKFDSFDNIDVAVSKVLERHKGSYEAWSDLLAKMVVTKQDEFSIFTVAIARLQAFQAALDAPTT